MVAEISDVDQDLAATFDRVEVMTWAMSNPCLRGDPGYYLLAILGEDQVVTAMSRKSESFASIGSLGSGAALAGSARAQIQPARSKL